MLAYLAVGMGVFHFHSAWAALIGFHIAIVSSLLVARPNIPLKILVRNHRFQWILLSVAMCGSSGLTLYLLWNYFGFAPDLRAQVRSLGLNRTSWIPFIAYFALVNPWIEEYFWRGYLGSHTTNPSVSDFLYAGFHGLILINKVQIGSIVFGLTALVLAGWFWRQIARVDGGLLAPALGHMAADLAILSVLYLQLA